MEKIRELFLGFLSSDTIANLIAKYLTDALSKIENKEKAALIGEAGASTCNAGKVMCDAAKDLNISGQEVQDVTVAFADAIKKIIAAAK